jgi:hypothetical protein
MALLGGSPSSPVSLEKVRGVLLAAAATGLSLGSADVL